MYLISFNKNIRGKSRYLIQELPNASHVCTCLAVSIGSVHWDGWSTTELTCPHTYECTKMLNLLGYCKYLPFVVWSVLNINRFLAARLILEAHRNLSCNQTFGIWSNDCFDKEFSTFSILNATGHFAQKENQSYHSKNEIFCLSKKCVPFSPVILVFSERSYFRDDTFRSANDQVLPI
jgi:hypothetical protein